MQDDEKGAKRGLFWYAAGCQCAAVWSLLMLRIDAIKKKKISSTSGTYKISFLTGKNKIGDSAPTTGSVVLCFFCFGAFLVLSQGVDGFAKSGAINLNALGITLVVHSFRTQICGHSSSTKKKKIGQNCVLSSMKFRQHIQIRAL